MAPFCITHFSTASWRHVACDLKKLSLPANQTVSRLKECSGCHVCLAQADFSEVYVLSIFVFFFFIPTFRVLLVQTGYVQSIPKSMFLPVHSCSGSKGTGAHLQWLLIKMQGTPWTSHSLSLGHIWLFSIGLTWINLVWVQSFSMGCSYRLPAWFLEPPLKIWCQQTADHKLVQEWFSTVMRVSPSHESCPPILKHYGHSF